MKRNILFYLSFYLLFMSCCWMSCDDLEFGDDFLSKSPSTDVTIDTIYNEINTAEDALWNAYSTLPYRINIGWGDKENIMGMDLLESLSDLVQSYLNWGGAVPLYYGGQYDAGTENSSNETKYHYTQELSWSGIRKSWLFIENIDQVPDATQEYKDQLKAEARVIIAIHYSDMFRHYGGLPWINGSVSPDADFNSPRLTAKATLDSIISVLDLAIPDLPWVVEDLQNWEGRMTRASAMGLKARMLLFGASPLFNDTQAYLEGEASEQQMTWYGGKDESLWVEAKDAAKELIDEVESLGGYALVNTGNPRQDFQDGYYDRGVNECLISTRSSYKSGGYWSSYYFYQSAGGYGTGCATQNYVDMFPMTNGKAITDPDSGYDPNNPYLNRDPRLYETVLVNGDTFRSRTAELWIGGQERVKASANGRRTGYGIRKFWLDGNTATSVQSVVHWPYLRLPEIYLSYAEAENEVNGPTAEAYKYLNLVRQRVGVGDLETGLSQEEFRKAVLNERAIEFGYEEVRWFDLIRWKMEDDFQKTLTGCDITKDGEDLTYTYWDLPERYWKQQWSPKWYLSAFPPDEINKDYGLIQNPGW